MAFKKEWVRKSQCAWAVGGGRIRGRAGRAYYRRGPRGESWKIRSYCAAFPSRGHPCLSITASQEPTSSQKSVPAIPHQGSEPPSPTPSSSPASPNAVPQTQPSQCSPAWLHPQPQEGELATAQWGLQGPAATRFQELLLPVSSQFLCCCGPLHRGALPLPLTWLESVHPYLEAVWVPPLGLHATHHPDPVDCGLLCRLPLFTVCPVRSAFAE